MKCEHCTQQEATCFYQINTNGSVSSYALCGSCAAKMGLSSHTQQYPFGGFAQDIGHLFDGFFTVPAKPTQKSTKACPDCGATWREIAASGKVFCAGCYNAFREELEPTLRSLHANAIHTGRAPVKQRTHREKNEKLAALREELKLAIQEENFEKAAILRDEIRTLEKE